MLLFALNVLVTAAADDILNSFISLYFRQNKTTVHVNETIHMEYQALFSLKRKARKSSVTVLNGALMLSTLDKKFIRRHF